MAHFLKKHFIYLILIHNRVGFESRTVGPVQRFLKGYFFPAGNRLPKLNL